MFDRISKTIIDGYVGYWDYLNNELLYPGIRNYLWWLIGLSVFVWILEILFPWRKDQHAFRKDFWMDGFYMLFNFFLFSLIGYNALSNVVVDLFNTALLAVGVKNLVAINIASWPGWAKLLTVFFITDFLHWNIHRLLHHVPWLWEFHKVHHSVEEMGFAAHLRFHWMETIVYRTLQYIPLAMIGFGLQDFFLVHIFSLAVGHFNHANLNITWGPLRYVLNSPNMHIWHHARNLPKDRIGVNYGITLSIWDYLFGSAFLPRTGRDEALGFEDIEKFPKNFVGQALYPFRRKN
jgi:sterol desaturase/sphingolipid hydroxylase (fatty acid hydroxylase superfamily)